MFLVIGFLAGLFTLYQAVRLYQNPSIIIEWATASELEVAGFNILRAENPDGPFIQINDSLVPSSGDPLTGGEYSYQDFSVEGGKNYTYQLQEVELSGAVAIHGPIEAKAQRGGIAEAVLGVVLVLGAGLLFVRKQEP